MSTSDDIKLETFCEEIITFAVNEFSKIRDEFENFSPETSPFFEDVGKAVTMFGLMHQKKVACTMIKIRGKLFSSTKLFETFVSNFSDSYFQSLDMLPHQFFLTSVLTFCGVVASMADFCFRQEELEFAQVCVDSLYMELESCLEDIQALGGWAALRESAKPFADLYDSKSWIKE